MSSTSQSMVTETVTQTIEIIPIVIGNPEPSKHHHTHSAKSSTQPAASAARATEPATQPTEPVAKPSSSQVSSPTGSAFLAIPRIPSAAAPTSTLVVQAPGPLAIVPITPNGFNAAGVTLTVTVASVTETVLRISTTTVFA